MALRVKLFITIPLVNDKNQSAGSMFRVAKHKPHYLPRIGESVYILPETYLNVEAVNYSGLGLNWVHLVLQPIASEYRASLEKSITFKKENPWIWSKDRIQT